MTQQTENRELVLSYMASFETADPEMVAAHVAEDFENDQQGLLGTKFFGKDLYRERLSGFFGQFKKLRYSVDEIIATENRVAVAYTMHALNNERLIELPGMMFFLIENNLITKRSDIWDGLSYLEQAGVDLQPLGMSS